MAKKNGFLKFVIGAGALAAAGKVAYLFETLDRLRKSVSIDGSYITR